jgi:hypothetical protein
MNLDDEHLETLTSVQSEFEAKAIVAALEEEGIRATAVGGFTSGFKAEAPGYVSVIVNETDLERAKKVLDDLKSHRSDIDWSQVDTEDTPDGES